MAAAAVPSKLAALAPRTSLLRSNDAQGGSATPVTLSLIWGIRDPHVVKLSEQIGVTHSIAGTNMILRNLPRDRYVDAVAKLKADYGAAGLKIAGIESHPVDADKIKLGLRGRDE